MSNPKLRLTLIALSLAAACKSAPTATPTAAAAPAPAAVAESPAPPPAPVAKAPVEVTAVEGATEYHLDNGLRVVLFPDDSQAKLTVNITYMVGSRHEGYGEAGMAHLLEHMMFKGTPRHPDGHQELRAHGAFLNASTWWDRTNYYETLPATDENLKLALEIEADRMINATIRPEDLASEFSVVRNEFELNENDPGSVLGERMRSTAYLWHGYGRDSIGSRSDIERVPADRLKSFYQRFYRPDNAVLIVTGKIDPQHTLEMVAQQFGSLARPAQGLPKTYTIEPVQDGERSVTLRRSGDVQVVGLAYHIVAGPDERYTAIDAIEFALTDRPKGRLFKALVESGMASSVGTFSLAMFEPGFLQISADVPVGKSAEAVRDKMIQVVEALGKSGLTDDEIQRWRANSLKNWELAMASAQTASVLFSEAQAAGDWRLVFLWRDRIEKLTTKAATQVAAEYLRPSNRTVGMFLPTKTPDRAPLTEAPDLVAMLKDYKGREAASKGEEFAATLENIKARTTTRKLAGGIEAAFLPKETRGDVVVAQLGLHYGSEKELTGNDTASGFIAPMLMRGSKRLSYDQIKVELDKLKAQVQMTGTDGNALVTIRTTRPNLAPTLALVSEILRQPVFPKDQFEILKKEMLTGLEESLSDPEEQAEVAAMRKLNPYPKTDVRYVPTTQESIARVKATTVVDVKKLYSSLWGASHAELSVVGDFDPAEVTAAVEKGLGDWKSPRPFVRIATPYKAVEPAAEVINTPDKESATVMAAFPFAMREDDPDYPALRIANLALGSGMEARLMSRLRQKEGLTYGTYSFIGIDALDQRATFFAVASVAPQNAERGLALLLEETEKLLTAGITDAELTRSKSIFLQGNRNQLASDDWVAGTLRNNLYLDRTLDFQMKMNAAIEALTPADITRVLAKNHIKPAGFIKVTAGDMNKAKAGAPGGAPAARP